MQVHSVLSPRTAIVVFSTILLHSPTVYPEQEGADWWKAQRNATAILMEREASIAKLAADVSASTPENGQDAMFKLCVLMRAGMNKEAIEALRELKALSPRINRNHVVSIYHDACGNLEAWDVAKATVEVFAEDINIALDSCLLQRFLNSGWTFEKVDNWLAAMPKGSHNFWVKERLRFNIKHGRGEVLVRNLADSVRENPRDIEGAVAFLDALAYARHTGEEKWNLSWMAGTVKPSLATEAERIAWGLKKLDKWTTAIRFYQRAIDTPMTEDESRKPGMLYAAFVPFERLRAMFAAHAREEMADCLLKLGKGDRAQKWMVEAADIRKKHNLGLAALFAGQVQAASGQRTVEGRIKEEEKKSENDLHYWRDRARYYRGRNEPAQEEEAILKGLALLTPQPEPEQGHNKGLVQSRIWLLSNYAHFLQREKRTDEAVALLRKEIERAPATSESARSAANSLAFDFYREISVDDALLWNWLANRPKWEHTEQRLLWRLLQSAKRDDLDKHFVRAEQFVLGKDPSRASTLGWIMNRMDFPRRSIPLLEYAVENAHDEELRGRTHLTLLESYLDTGDWEHAAGVFPQAAKRLTARELPGWYSRVAVAAAKAGAKTDAMRIWSRVANLRPSQIDGLEDLVEAGLRNELKNFYRKMQKEMPSSEFPAKALIALGKN